MANYQPGEICIYTNILEKETEVTFIRHSTEAATALVQDGSREIWVRLTQIRSTGKMYQEDPAAAAPQKQKGWTWGDAPPSHLIKEKGKRK